MGELLPALPPPYKRNRTGEGLVETTVCHWLDTFQGHCVAAKGIQKAIVEQSVDEAVPPSLPLGRFEVINYFEEGCQVALFWHKEPVGCSYTTSSQHVNLPLPETQHKDVKTYMWVLNSSLGIHIHTQFQLMVKYSRPLFTTTRCLGTD